MNMPMIKCKKYLASLWFMAAAVLFVLMLLQTTLGHYRDKAADAWGWLLPALMPTLSLVIGVLVTELLGKNADGKKCSSYLFKLTFGISALYLVALLLQLLLQPFSPAGPLDSMKQSQLWLAPFQGMVAAVMGAFFVKDISAEVAGTRQAEAPSSG